MKKLLSLPPNLVGSFHDITELPQSEWFCTNDPVGKKLGSGGGTTWLLRAAYEDYKAQNADAASFDEWLAADKRLLLHAGGQSRQSKTTKIGLLSLKGASKKQCSQNSTS